MDALFVGGVTAESIKAPIEDAHERRAVLERELARSAEPVDISGAARSHVSTRPTSGAWSASA